MAIVTDCLQIMAYGNQESKLIILASQGKNFEFSIKEYSSEETIQVFITYVREKLMRKLYELFKVLQFQKRIVAVATV